VLLALGRQAQHGHDPDATAALFVLVDRGVRGAAAALAALRDAPIVGVGT
jgi:hypothetical protein